MTTDLKTSELLLAYDGDCPMCLATIGLLLRLGLVRPEQTRSNHDLDAADLAAAQQAGIRNQLVVIDLTSRETRAGSDALLWIIGAGRRGKFLVRVLGLPGLRHLLRYGYETISYNRRVVSPPRHQVVCDCEPEVTVARRMTLIVPLLLVTILLVAGFGAAAFVGWGLGDALTGALFTQIAAGAGWVVMIVAGVVLLGGMQRIDYVAHLVVTMFAGALVLLPAAILTPLVGVPVSIALVCVSLLAAFALMFAMQRRRVAAIGLGATWLWAWAIVLVLTTGGSILSHFREQLF
jgi:predicted DCC family thiol-disulfide oxidoreductase YuxK